EVERNGILARNPAEWTNVPQEDDADGGGEDAAAKAMDEEQAREFLEAARGFADAQGDDDPHPMPERCWSALWHVLMTGGLRPGEAFALQWTDLDEIGEALQIGR